jgi:hypothetical protein
MPQATSRHICFWEVQCLNFCWVTVYTKWISLWFSSSAPGNCQDYNISLRWQLFPCKSPPVHHSPVIFPSTLYGSRRVQWNKKKSCTLKFQGLSAMHFTRCLVLSTISHIFPFLHSWAQGYVWMVTYNRNYQKDHNALIMFCFHCLKYKLFLVMCLIKWKYPLCYLNWSAAVLQFQNCPFGTHTIWVWEPVLDYTRT